MRPGRRRPCGFPFGSFVRVSALLAATASAAAVGGEPPAGQSPASAPSREAGPVVMSKEKAGQIRRPSSFLSPPGADRYDPGADDWGEIPLWRQTTFFGVRARGQFFVYVVDCSESMIDEDRLARAKEEVRRSVSALQPPQKFKVIFYNDAPIPMPGDLPRPADPTSKNQLASWLRLIEPVGGTDPRAALGLALALRPDAVFLLTDGEFAQVSVETYARRNPAKVPIHCIDLSTEGTGARQLQQIARDSGGRYVWRPWTGP